MSESPYQHVVLTRFNALTGYSDRPEKRIDPVWLTGRFDLFDRFCYPSLQAQRVEFDWLVFFDAGTPVEFRERIDRYDRLTPVYVEEPLTDPLIASAVHERLRPNFDYLITTRVDNDDAIADSYLERVQGEFRSQPLEFVNFPIGFDRCDDRLYLRVARSNTFMSLIERIPRDRSQIRTVHCAPHDHLGSVAPVRQVLAPPLWQVVIHGGNVTNEVLGIRRPGSATPSGFSGEGGQIARDRWPAVTGDVVASTAKLLALPIRRRRSIAARLKALLQIGSSTA